MSFHLLNKALLYLNDGKRCSCSLVGRMPGNNRSLVKGQIFIDRRGSNCCKKQMLFLEKPKDTLP